MGATASDMAATGLDNIDSMKALLGPISKLSDKTASFARATVLSTETINAMGETFSQVNSALSILVGVAVSMILLSSVFIFYNAGAGSGAQLANNIATLILAILVVISLGMLKLTFYGVNTILFDETNGTLLALRNMLAPK